CARDSVPGRSRLAGLQLGEQLPPEGVVLVQVGVRRQRYLVDEHALHIREVWLESLAKRPERVQPEVAFGRGLDPGKVEDQAAQHIAVELRAERRERDRHLTAGTRHVDLDGGYLGRRDTTEGRIAGEWPRVADLERAEGNVPRDEERADDDDPARNAV